MRRRRTRARVGALTFVLVAAAIGSAYLTVSRGQSDARSADELPTALGSHLEKLRQAVPGNSGMAEEGPASAAESEFVARAYPDETISVADMDRARSAFAAAAKRPFKGKAKPGEWRPIGPSEALYPFSEFRGSFNYVPTAYVAGGRTTSIAVRQENCVAGDCRAWITPAGGGVWRTNDLFADDVTWTYLGGPLGINAAGSVTLDPNDPTENTIYVGTGEANVCGSGCVAGVGLYKSVNGGQTWTHLGKDELGGKGIGSVAIKPGDSNTIYAATTTALRGHSSVCCSGVTRPIPGAAKWGLYKSTDGGASWNFIHNGTADTAQCTGTVAEFNNLAACSPRGVRNVVLDPSDPNTVYASSYARGVWRSSDGGATWTQIKPSLNAAVITTRPNIAVTTLPTGATRMYVVEGNTGAPYSRLFRSDDVRTGAPVFTDLTSSNPADPGYATFNICTGQCWYDAFVYTPKGHPDVVYVGGSYSYGETARISNGRGVVLSTDAGVSGTDMTMDGTDPIHPNGLHPDQHALVTHPSNPFQFVEVNDGGVMRSSGSFVDRSSWCAPRGLTGTNLSRCQQLLSRVPSELKGLNDGLSTLQFQSLSVSPHDVNDLQGGTQDNGTWENRTTSLWENTMIGDGGQSGWDVAKTEFRFHNFFDATAEVNFDNGDIADWIWVADPIFGHAGTQFYAPVISDPKVSGTMFAGTGRTAYRTKTHGLGTMTLEQAQQHCNTWTGDFAVQCGDWAQLGSVRLTAADFGDRAGGAVAAIERTTADSSSAWAATTTGRVFVSKNADADPASAVTWARIDTAATPNRFVSSIYVDPANGNRAWVSYSGFTANTPATPGHVFEVVYNPATGTATWTNLSHDLGDQPVTDLVRDDVTGDLYSSSDFGVMRLAAGTTSWTLAAAGMPSVEVAGLTIVPAARVLYAASHGLSAWRLDLG
jgi:hypothetical protein